MPVPLARWSNSPATQKFAGQASLLLEGVFFTPHAILDYTGSGAQDQVAAQFVTLFLHIQGSGPLSVAPSPVPEPALIR